MGRFVIAAFRPKPGQKAALERVVAKHSSVLASRGLITERAPYVMRATDGTILEVFEWRSAEAIEAAHADPTVHALWAEFAAACDYVSLGELAESQHPFAEFEALAL
jgi:quinol monooxygenase YgiN